MTNAATAVAIAAGAIAGSTVVVLFALRAAGLDSEAERRGDLPAPPTPTTDPIPLGDLFTDRHGRRYTTHVWAHADDPWYGATVLTPTVVRSLRDRGLLPLTPADPKDPRDHHNR